jgi:curved DNA-binding protein CbpA
MKTFEHDNYYEILQVSVNARADEIKQAYRDALAMYDQESIATYALFSDTQRQVLLQAIESAFDNLINEDKRAAYNQMLIDTGQVAASAFSRPAQRKLAAHSKAQVATKEQSLGQWVKKQSDLPEIRRCIEAIHATDRLSGAALMQLRDAYGIELNEIYAITKISGDTLKRIEADQYDDLPAGIFLKQFLRSYAELLQLDAQHVVDSYLARMTGAPPPE